MRHLEASRKIWTTSSGTLRKTERLSKLVVDDNAVRLGTRVKRRLFCSKGDHRRASGKMKQSETDIESSITPRDRFTEFLQRARLTEHSSEGDTRLLRDAFHNLVRDDAYLRFYSWRKRHTVLLVSAGIISGAILSVAGLYLYIESYPYLIEQFFVVRTTQAFAKALSFENKKALYFGLPQPSFPTQEKMMQLTMEEIKKLSGKQVMVDETDSLERSLSPTEIMFLWSDMVVKAFKTAETNWSLMSKNAMRDILFDECNDLETVEEQLDALRELLPSSIELNLLTNEKLQTLVSLDKFIPSEIMNKNRPQFNETTCDVLTRMLINAITFFPGPFHLLIRVLTEPPSSYESKSNEGLQSMRETRGVFPHDNIVITSESRPVSDGGFQLNPLVMQTGFADALEIKVEASSSDVKENIPRYTSDKVFCFKTVKKYLTRLKDPPTFDDPSTFIQSLRQLPGLMKLRVMYQSLTVEMQHYVLETALTATISMLPTVPIVGDFNPQKLYEKAIEEGLISSLRKDARISEDILDEVRTIFLALPPDVQARVLLTAVTHPSSKQFLTSQKQTSFSREVISFDNQAELVRDLLLSAGVVAVKLGQMLAEHPNMPVEYQRLLGSLREDNPPMHYAKFWYTIPTAVRANITHLGECLGTGSVKQVHRAKFRDHSSTKPSPSPSSLPSQAMSQSKNNMKTKEVAVGVLRHGVEDEALCSISALETSEEVGPIAKRLGRLVFGEFNLFEEGVALQEFAVTEIGTHPLFRVVDVYHHSPKCLVEEVARGQSVASVLSDPGQS